MSESAAASAMERLEEKARAKADEDDLEPRAIPLSVVYVDPESGEEHEDVFTCTTLGPKRKVDAEVFAKAMGAPYAWEDLPLQAQNRLLACGLTLWSLGLDETLRRRERHWLVAALEEDEDFLALVDQERRAHDARYFRGRRAARGQAKGSRRLLVAPLVVRKDPAEARGSDAG